MREIFDQLSSTFSNSTRLQIMHLLNEEPLTITGLTAKIPNTSASVISRHLSTLDEHGFITKKLATGREYQLSPFGESIYYIMQPLVFFLKNSTYFRSHSLASLPVHFLCNINALEHTRFIEGTGSVISALTNFVTGVKMRLEFMSNTHIVIPNSNLEEIHAIYPVKLIEKIGIQKIREDIKESTNLAINRVQMRSLPEIDIGIAIAGDGEKGVAVCPRNDETALDYAGMFVVEDETGMEYLKRIWEYYWAKAEPVSLE